MQRRLGRFALLGNEILYFTNSGFPHLRLAADARLKDDDVYRRVAWRQVQSALLL